MTPFTLDRSWYYQYWYSPRRRIDWRLGAAIALFLGILALELTVILAHTPALDALPTYTVT
jgi:hypothetical protein